MKTFAFLALLALGYTQDAQAQPDMGLIANDQILYYGGDYQLANRATLHIDQNGNKLRFALRYSHQGQAKLLQGVATVEGDIAIYFSEKPNRDSPCSLIFQLHKDHVSIAPDGDCGTGSHAISGDFRRR